MSAFPHRGVAAARHSPLSWATMWRTRWADTRLALVTAVSVMYAVLFALNVATLLTPARLSFRLDIPSWGAARIAYVLPGGSLWDQGVRAGDRALTVDGRVPGHALTGHAPIRRLTVRTRSGAVLVLDVGALRRGHSTWPVLLLSPWFLLLGTLVVLRAPPTIGRAAYALFVSAACALALAPAADNDDALAMMIEWTAGAFFASCFAGFFLTFPTPRGTARGRAVLFLPPLLGAARGLASLRWTALYDAAYLARMAVLLAYLLAGAGLLVSSFRRARDGDTRRGLTIISAGTVASIAPFTMLYLLPVVLHGAPLLSSETAILALALLPASFAYAILRHKVLNIPLLQRWLAHGLLWGMVFALCLAVAYGLRHVADTDIGGPIATLFVFAVLVLLTGLAFRRPYDGLRRVLDAHLFKDAYDYRDALERLSRDLSLAGDLDTLAAALPDRLQRLMNLDFAVLLADEARGALGDRGPHTPCPVNLAAATRAVQGEPRAVSLADGETAVLVVPLRTHDRLVGHLCLGPKRSGEPFRPEDRALLSTLSGQLAALVRNAQLVDELRAQVNVLQAREATLDTLNERLQHAQEEERARLAADLHDEVLQTALHLRRRLIADGQGRAAADGHVAVAEAVIDQLRLVCTSVRPPALDELGLAAALEALALDLGAGLTVPILLDADPALTELALSPDIELVIYRAAQEALNNALRHARPATIRMTLRCDDGAVRLSVCDDGDGFVVPERLDTLAAAGHLGLVGLQRRVGHAGGRLSVIAAPGRGTVVRVAIPVVVMKGVTE